METRNGAVLSICVAILLTISMTSAAAIHWEEAFYNHGSVMLLIDTVSGQIVDTNDAAVRFYGYSRDHLLGMNISDINVMEPEAIAQERLAAAREERNFFIFPHRLADGTIRTVEVHSYPIDDQEQFLLSAVYDITERLALEEDLWDRNQRLRRAEAIVGLGSWQYDPDADLFWVSEGAKSVLGLNQEYLTMAELDAITVPEHRELRQQALERVVSGAGTYDIELDFIHGETGQIVHIHSIAQYESDTGFLFGTLLDISDQVVRANALAASNRRERLLFSGFVLLQAAAILVLIHNIKRRRSSEQALAQNLDRTESLVRIQQHQGDSIDELFDYALEESIRLTDSKIGYVFLYDEDSQRLSLKSWSKDVAPQCEMKDKPIMFQLSDTGLWGESIRQRGPIVINDYHQEHPAKKGYPEGHVGLTRFMSFPIFDQDRIKAVVGLANKENAYNQADVMQVTLLMTHVWTAVERKKGEVSLAEGRERLQATLLSVADGVIALDAYGSIELMNPAAQRLTRWTEQEAIGQPLRKVFHAEGGDMESTNGFIKEIFSRDGEAVQEGKTVLLTKVGTRRAVSFSTAPIRSQDGDVTGTVVVFRDITAEKQRLDEIEYLSYHDPLTGLHNRRYFDQQLQLIDISGMVPVSVVVADVDGLKLVNDTIGHQAGDELIKTAAEILKANFRTGDIVARWGGDEFVMILPGTPADQVKAIIARVRTQLEQESIDSFTVSLSFGWAAKTEPQQRIEEVFKDAELQMYRQKVHRSPNGRSDTIHTLMAALYEKNRTEEEHSQRIGQWAAEFGAHLGLTKEQVDELYLIGLFHDIGKIAVDESILNKPGSLTSEERKNVERHSDVGYRLLGNVQDMADVAPHVLSHHEHWDGNGYPQGIKGEEISLQARIIHILDAFDSMTHDRPYRKAMSTTQAREELRSNAGIQFDPTLVESFQQFLDTHELD